MRGDHGAGRRAQKEQGQVQYHRHGNIAEQHQPKAPVQHPNRPQQKGPEIEAVAHEPETVRPATFFVPFQRRLMDREDGHLRTPNPNMGSAAPGAKRSA